MPVVPATTPPFRRTAYALFGLLISGACTQAWAAQPQALTSSQVRSYQIPAGNLGQTLSRFAAESHIALSFDPSLTDGQQSPGLSGSYSPLEALTRLLSGTGLDLQQRADASYTLVRSANADALQLAPTSVTGQGLGVTTEGTRSYTTDEVSIGKGNIKLKDIPQSVSVVTRQRMDDQNMNSLQDAMRQVTGATIKTYNAGSSLNDVYMRGFLVDQVQVDGVSQPTGQGDMATSFDLAMYDRIEVLRGPSGLYQGAGEPGGTINVVRKRALNK